MTSSGLTQDWATAGQSPAETMGQDQGSINMPPTRWYKGNLHTHSMWSDGDDYPEMIARWYKSHDYDFIAFSDHNIVPNFVRWLDVESSYGGRRAYERLKATYPDLVDERVEDGRLEVRLRTVEEVNTLLGSPGEFLVIQAQEITDKFEDLHLHLNATNVDEFIAPSGGSSVYQVLQNNIDAVVAVKARDKRSILIHVNHPNFGGAVAADDLMRLRGENFFEVYNGHPISDNDGGPGYPSTDTMWDMINTRRLTDLGLPMMYALAVDDSHDYHDHFHKGGEPGRGWICVDSSDLTAESIIAAIEDGRFYASTGVDLLSVDAGPEGLAVVIDAEEGVDYTIEFVGSRVGVGLSSLAALHTESTQISSDHHGVVLGTVHDTNGAYSFAGDELYVRARITSSAPHPNPSSVGESQRAWVQPILGPAAQR